ncbi:MAG: hypothetical protein ACSHX4_12570 [Opitutaceae bacterium]
MSELYQADCGQLIFWADRLQGQNSLDVDFVYRMGWHRSQKHHLVSISVYE